ncbi:MAG TPA: hypothetical protein VGI48_00925 [Caldimonas sp.]|jgi:hypothetical protein
MRVSVFAAIAASSLALGTAIAKLPPPSDEAKAKAAEAANKAGWSGKVAAYELCQTEDRLASAYRAHAVASGQPASAAEQTPPCANPGPYKALEITSATSKPLEASGAHSPPGAATSPPSNKATSAEMTGPRK